MLNKAAEWAALFCFALIDRGGELLLTASRLPDHLTERGVIDRAAIVQGDLEIEPVAGRNLGFIVRRRQDDSLYVKQVRAPLDELEESLRREASCYLAMADLPNAERLCSRLPRLVDYDAARNVLIIQFLDETTNLLEYQSGMQEFCSRAAQALASALIDLHEAGRVFAADDLLDVLRAPAQALTAYQLPDEAIPYMGPGGRDLLTLARQSGDVINALESLASGWSAITLMHGDVRFENALISSSVNQSLHLIDWELCDIGDPAWDVAGALHSYLVTRTCLPWARQSEALQYVPTLLTAAQEFWSTYVKGQMLANDLVEFRERCIRLMGARLIQAAFEHACFAPTLTAEASELFEQGRNYLAYPQAGVDAFTEALVV